MTICRQYMKDVKHPRIRSGEILFIIILVHRFFHIVRVRGTPASGKTTIMNLLANKLLEYDPETPLYVLSGWDKDTVKDASGWAGYPKQQTGLSMAAPG
ncbi:hypothetical protein P175DRAFT_0527785 [Aspergillus ochraceoroseus IBT 24754]|uniref:Uncharacterized protein n=1 Tax=Aspergillus ochraceoroseus IBT 24754 TaxID=1392256 RepID=A0A2T5M719_9EURO|nr:uncharacterized protein P175DRAFT_0527785 [Aspergillus ochraceoroseus IBT 24754]PTU24323.1 hypothetical protein P175DRAFT_0527785 [Aspergillus ochraceoroseus IBT 24754]